MIPTGWPLTISSKQNNWSIRKAVMEAAVVADEVDLQEDADVAILAHHEVADGVVHHAEVDGTKAAAVVVIIIIIKVTINPTGGIKV